MSSAQDICKHSRVNEMERKSRPSPLGQFFSRIGSARHRSRSARDPPFSSKDTVAPCSPELTCSHENDTSGAEGTVTDENRLRVSPPPKPKRHSSPFVRIIHRLSINRKSREAPSNPSTRNCSDLGENKLNSSRETVYSTSIPSTAFASGVDILSRPAISENDLRFVALHKDQEMERSATGLFMNTNGIRSEGDFPAVTRVPSYLRISCALNGYRRPYRRLEESCQWLNSTPKKLPMGIVEARALAFSQNSDSNDQKRVKLEEVTNRSNSQMGDDVSSTAAPVQQLVAKFDRMRESTAKMHNDLGRELENIRAEGSHDNGNIAVVNETHTTSPLQHPLAPQNSIAVSGQLYGAAYLHTSPKPSVAQRMHRAFLKTTMESVPNAENQAEIRIENGQSANKQVAEKIRNENCINFALPDGEAYRSLLNEAMATLQLHCDEAKNDLEKEDSLPEYAAGALRTAVGKANLLVDKKMAKFRELVEIHLDQKANEKQQVTLSDLSGYWALISIELKELDGEFREISLLRENSWEKQETETSSASAISENRGDGLKKLRPISPFVNGEKMAIEAHRRQVALAAAKRRQKELKKANEQQFGEPSDGRMII